MFWQLFGGISKPPTDTWGHCSPQQRYGVLYAASHKNFSTAGVCYSIIRRDAWSGSTLGKSYRKYVAFTPKITGMKHQKYSNSHWFDFHMDTVSGHISPAYSGNI
jgi:hypothetical protein